MTRIIIFLLISILTQDLICAEDPVIVAAERTQQYIPYLKNKNIALVANHSSLIGNTHLADSLLALDIKLMKIFSPEHGFRGNADAGEILGDSIDSKTGLPVISLYGKNKKPSREYLTDIDVVVFDIQDVGVRFYTYFSTMHYVMEACAENDIELMILDRPNPNGFFVDGPVLDMKYKSFVGMHPVALVHGMTAAEYSQMINNEGWLKDGIKCKLKHVLCENYSHSSFYNLPINPSPNLKNMNAVYLYSSLGLFEGTVINVGRGTDSPFEMFGHPRYSELDFSFIPEENEGAKYPKYKNEICYGIDLKDYYSTANLPKSGINLGWLIHAYANYPEKQEFFNSFFKYLVGNEQLQKQIENGEHEDSIKRKWNKELKEFKKIRKEYILYKDF